VNAANIANAVNATNATNAVNLVNTMNAVNTANTTNAKGRLLTTQRHNKVARSSRATNNERNFGDSGYEVTA